MRFLPHLRIISTFMLPLSFLGVLFHIPTATPEIAQANYTVRYVVPDQSQCGANTPCYTQIQTAVDAANTGDEIWVAAGTYRGVSSRYGSAQLVYVSKSIIIRGGYDPASWTWDPASNASVLDAQGLGQGLHISGAVSPVIEGLQITNGSADKGGGIYIESAVATLRQNKVYGNTATSSGAGIYLSESPSTIASNDIYSNTTGSNGRGGGITIASSSAEIRFNTITGNSAHVGGGVELANYSQDSGAFLYSNTINNNTAFDYQPSGNTFDGSGGGIHIGSYYTDTVKQNRIEQNAAKRGGGLYAFNAPVLILENTLQDNYAPYHGGGLYVQGGQPTIKHNDILSNTADSWGGGLWIWANDAMVSNNTFQGNTAAGRGGGIYTQDSGSFDGNIVRSNTSVGQGGGMFSYLDNEAIYSNNVWIDNHAAEGAGIYFWGSISRLLQNTVVGNVSGDGKGIVIDKYPGLVNPSAPEHMLANVSFTNTILVDHPVGIFATEGNALTVNGILWNNTPTHIQATGASLTLQNEHTGDPRFRADGYHLQNQNSAAMDAGVEEDIDHDVDGHLRPLGLDFDLGADEIIPSVEISPDTGGSIAFSGRQGFITITVTVPPRAFTSTVGLAFIPFPPLPPGIGGTLFGGFTSLGPPFRLTPLTGGFPDPTIMLTKPITVTVAHEPSSELPTGLVQLQEILNEMTDGRDLYKRRLASCPSPDNLGQVPDIRISTQITGTSVSLCGLGGVPSPIVPDSQVLQFQVGSAEVNSEFVYFLFAAESSDYKSYLPVVLRQN